MKQENTMKQNRIYVGRWTQDVDVKKVSGTVPVEYSGNLNGYTITFSSGYRF
jgi:hypothetical protein